MITNKFDIIPIIDPVAYYTVSQILKLGLIPTFIDTKHYRDKLYTVLLYSENSIRKPYTETTKTTIKTLNWANIVCNRATWKVQWMEIIKFLQLNNLLPK